MTDNGRTHISLSQRAYDCIKQQIVSLQLPPGSVIDEAGLQSRLGLGRTPIREALQRLALEKLVTIVPRRGMFVTEIGVMDLPRLFELRVTLESLAARLAAQRGTADHWQQMEAALNRLPPEHEPVDNQTLITIDQACHEIMYEAADNPFLSDTLGTMYALSLRLWYFALASVGDMRGAVLEHVDILQALKAKDTEQAGHLVDQHINRFQQEIQSVMLGVTPR